MVYKDWLKDHCKNKLVSGDEAISKVKSGSRVFIGTGCGEPQHLIRTLVNDTTKQDITIYQMLSFTLAEFVNERSFLERFSLKLFFISQPLREAAFDGKIDYIPAYLIPDSASVLQSTDRYRYSADSGQSAG